MEDTMKPTIKKYEVIEDSHALEKGDIVYTCPYNDYGLTADDTMIHGGEWIFVSMKPNGDYPGVTVEKHKVKEIAP
jgi:glycine cleavage system aminomethyltransferase T